MERERKDKSDVAALDKALCVMEYMARHKGGVSLREAFEDTGIPKPTLYRILSTLKNHGYVQQDQTSKYYRLGWALIFLSNAASDAFDLKKIVRPYLEKMGRESGESASLVQLIHNSAVYVDHVPSNNLIRSGLGVGSRLTINASAAGKVLLSGMPDSEIWKYIKAAPLQKLTDRTITDEGQLFEEIRKVRTTGYALDYEEGEIGCCCIAAPVTDWNNSIVAAMSITGPTVRITDEALPGLIQLVRDIAKETSVQFKPDND